METPGNKLVLAPGDRLSCWFSCYSTKLRLVWNNPIILAFSNNFEELYPVWSPWRHVAWIRRQGVLLSDALAIQTNYGLAEKKINFNDRNFSLFGLLKLQIWFTSWCPICILLAAGTLWNLFLFTSLCWLSLTSGFDKSQGLDKFHNCSPAIGDRDDFTVMIKKTKKNIL